MSSILPSTENPLNPSLFDPSPSTPSMAEKRAKLANLFTKYGTYSPEKTAPELPPSLTSPKFEHIKKPKPKSRPGTLKKGLTAADLQGLTTTYPSPDLNSSFTFTSDMKPPESPTKVTTPTPPTIKNEPLEGYHSRFSIEANRGILESIQKSGLASPEYLINNGYFPLCSCESSPEAIHTYLFNFKATQKNIKQIMAKASIDAGFSLNLIALERRTNRTQSNLTFNRTEKELSHLAAERLHNAILFEIDPEKIAKEKIQEVIDKQINGVYSFKDMIPVKALKKAYVPKDLVALFKSIYPNIDCVELSTKHVQRSFIYFNLGYESDRNRMIVDTMSPDFESALKDRLVSFVKKGSSQPLIEKIKVVFLMIGKLIAHLLQIISPSLSEKLLKIMSQKTPPPLIFHLVRLVAPSDEEFLQAEKKPLLS